MVEVTADGTELDLYVEACGRQATLIEFQETPTEIRARIVRRPETDPVGCHTSFRATLDEPLSGRPVIDLTTGTAVDVNELPTP